MLHVLMLCECMLFAGVTTYVHVANIVVKFFANILYVAAPRQGSMSAASANAVLSGCCNRFVGYL